MDNIKTSTQETPMGKIKTETFKDESGTLKEKSSLVEEGIVSVPLKKYIVLGRSYLDSDKTKKIICIADGDTEKEVLLEAQRKGYLVSEIYVSHNWNVSLED